jgi:hypothetical protein
VKLLGAILPDLLRQLAENIERGERVAETLTLEPRNYRRTGEDHGLRCATSPAYALSQEGGPAARSELETGNGSRIGGAPLPALRATTREVARTELDVSVDRRLGSAPVAPAPQYPGRRSVLTHRRPRALWLWNAGIEDGA